jgi:hypothetical protein
MVTTLGMEIKLHRVRYGLSQTALGKLLGSATERLVSLWEDDAVVPGPYYRRKLEFFLKTDPAALKWAANGVGLLHQRKRPLKLRRPLNGRGDVLD